ncbi:MAG: septal ring lytic transglycosylase RlpA family protein [Nitrosomonadales bacterium]|nr:septal ring lytic transglycosylase RlpA family protein [Nitrosomonadales bacterium]
MGKQTGSILFVAILLAACNSAPVRQVQTQSPVQVVEAGVVQAEFATPAPATTTPDAGQAAAPTAPPAGRGGYLAGDGPGADAPANLDAIPDAVPKAEPLHQYANRPYAALGKTYTPLDKPGSYKERGIASWYGKKFHGQRTSSGETYDMYGMTAAHPTLPIPSYARVTNVATGKSVVVRVNDRGPFLHDRIMDLSYTAAYKLGIIGNGSSEVEVESIAAAPDVVVTPLAVAEPIKSEPLAPAITPVTEATPAPVGNTYLQLGAFKSQQGAESFLAKMRNELEGSGKQVSLYQKGDLMRVHLGPYASADEARAVAEKLQAQLGFKPLINAH